MKRMISLIIVIVFLMSFVVAEERIEGDMNKAYDEADTKARLKEVRANRQADLQNELNENRGIEKSKGIREMADERRVDAKKKVADKRRNAQERVAVKRGDNTEILKDTAEERLAKLKADTQDTLNRINQESKDKLLKFRDDRVEKLTKLKDEQLEKLAQLKDERLRKLSKLGDEKLEKIASLDKEQLEKLALLGSERVRKLVDLDSDSLSDELSKFKVKKVKKEDLFKKRQVAKDKLEKSRDNFNKATQRFSEAKEKHKVAKAKFNELKVKAVCEDDTPECVQVKEDAKVQAKALLVNGAKQAIELMEQIKEKVSSSESMSQEEVDQIVLDLDDEILNLEAAIQKVEDATTKEEIKEAGKQITNVWNGAKRAAKKFAVSEMRSRVGVIVERSEHLEQRLEAAVVRIEEKGLDSSEIDVLIDSFNSKVGLARDNYDRAKILSPEEGRTLMKETSELLRKAHEDLKQILSLIKGVGEDIDDVDEQEVVIEEVESAIVEVPKESDVSGEGLTDVEDVGEESKTTIEEFDGQVDSDAEDARELELNQGGDIQ